MLPSHGGIQDHAAELLPVLFSREKFNQKFWPKIESIDEIATNSWALKHYWIATIVLSLLWLTLNFSINDLLQQPVEKPVWLESITAIPTESFSESYLEPESVESSGEYARRCGQDNFHIETDNGNLESFGRIMEY